MASPAPGHIDHEALVRKLCAHPDEAEWFEFKQSFADPHEIGEYFSALSNGARICDEQYGFMIWGVDDATHQIVGTAFDPKASKAKGNEDLIPWLTRGLVPSTWFEFKELTIDSKRVLVAQIAAAANAPVAFSGRRYIRVGSYKKPLSEHNAIEKRLWASFDERPFESRPALSGMLLTNIPELLDLETYFSLLNSSLPEPTRERVAPLLNEGLVNERNDGLYDVTQHGALLLAKSLSDFPTLERKALRVVQYEGTSKTPCRQQVAVASRDRVGHSNRYALLAFFALLLGCSSAPELLTPEQALKLLPDRPECVSPVPYDSALEVEPAGRRSERLIEHLTGIDPVEALEKSTGSSSNPEPMKFSAPNFGGVWGDSNRTGWIVALVECEAEDLNELIRMGGGPGFVTVIQVDHSHDQISDFRAQLQSEIEMLGVMAAIQTERTLKGRVLFVLVEDRDVLPSTFGKGVPEELFVIGQLPGQRTNSK